MIQETKTAVIMEPEKQVLATIIWLHGLGANGHDFVPVAKELNLADKGFRVILPHAPEMPVSINNGYVMPAWYDIHDSDLTQEPDTEGLERSAVHIRHLIDEQIQQGIKPERIVLVGFSQGGAVALYTGFRLPFPIAGIMSLSAYLPLADSFSSDVSPQSSKTPVFIGHGIYDPVIPPAAASMTEQTLKAESIEVETRSYPMEHSVSMEEVKNIGVWINKVLG